MLNRDAMKPTAFLQLKSSFYTQAIVSDNSTANILTIFLNLAPCTSVYG
ncbi:MAG: hypothetical protein KME06_06800 [Kastovskya adunca ATA6-11-RM4]|nr:hypothetical protein [Kastovskya adunca ATA6-11-RM4]